MKHLIIAATFVCFTGAAFAESHALELSGDAEAGKAAFDRQCVACHVVANEEGEVLAGRKARSGPNLYGVAMRTLGTVEGYRYGKSLVAAGEAGMVWDEKNFMGYVQNPTKWLRDALDDKKARGKMSFKVKKEQDAADLFAFLATISPVAETEADATN